MRKVMTLLCLLIGISWASAQMKVTGVVISADDGQPVIGASVVVKGTTHGTITDTNGKFSLSVPENNKTLEFSYVGMLSQEQEAKANMHVIMHSNTQQMNEVVVTALGISRDEKSLGYATQEVGGNTLNIAKPDNLINSLSGRVSGVDIKTSGNLGGSTNIIIRGDKSLMGNNQALFVVDGVPMNNTMPVSNTTGSTNNQLEGQEGYDYGTPASDIDPNNIKSISVLKGAAATALYGSRAANGVILITTKTGSDDKYAGKNGLGVSFSSNVTLGTIDRSTFPKYQTQYGAGYGPYYSGGGDGSQYPGLYYGPLAWTNGSNVYYVPTTEDASYGTKFDPNLMVYQWDAFVPESPNYHKATPWVAAKNGPITFFNTAVTTSNTLALSGSSKNSSFRFSYTNFLQKGILPNSHLAKNQFSLSASRKLAKNFTITSNANFTHENTIGRNGTGYMGNILTSFRQWWEVNVDVKELKNLYQQTGRNVTWNMSDPADGNTTPIYWNNYYWERYNNYENDSRNHLFGDVQLKWDITNYLNIIGRTTLDTYSQLEEEHIAMGSVPATNFGIGGQTVGSGYARTNVDFMETNYDLLINFNKNITKNLNITALAGGSIRRDNGGSIYASTNGGLVVPGLYAINNSVSQPMAPIEKQSTIGVNGIFGSVSLGLDNTYYLDATLRRDQSSTLPINNDSYYYPSISGSFLFSNLLKLDWLTFGKFRINYAEVGNDAPFGSLYDTYTNNGWYGSNLMYSVNTTENNPNLKPEKTKSSEAGLEMAFLNKRIGFDGDVYLTNTVDQIMPVAVSPATGYSYKYVNSGEVRNQGIELNVYGTPVKTRDFSWDVNVNWSINTNKVVSLYEGVNNLQLGSFQGGVTIDAQVGKPYGLLEGTDFVYKNGQKVVGSDGYYEITSTTNNVIGNSNPKWRGGITNSFTYKNWTASFLVDVQAGGSVFSLDQYYGQSDGIYPMTVGNNDLGNPMRNTLANGGGIILPGVYEDGTKNTTRITANDYTAFGYPYRPNSAFVYDASYVKLREAEISYNFESQKLEELGIHALSLGVVGSNLWIIYKNLPYADPEAGLGAGNMQGWQSGVMPTTRNFGFNLKVQF